MFHRHRLNVIDSFFENHGFAEFGVLTPRQQPLQLLESVFDVSSTFLLGHDMRLLFEVGIVEAASLIEWRVKVDRVVDCLLRGCKCVWTDGRGGKHRRWLHGPENKKHKSTPYSSKSNDD